MLLTTTQDPDLAQTVDSRLIASAMNLVWIETDSLYRPPRA